MVDACEKSWPLKAPVASLSHSDEGVLFSGSLVLGSNGEWDRSEPGVGNEVLVPWPRASMSKVSNDGSKQQAVLASQPYEWDVVSITNILGCRGTTASLASRIQPGCCS